MNERFIVKVVGLSIGTVVAFVLGVVTSPIWGSTIIVLWLTQMWKEELASK